MIAATPEEMETGVTKPLEEMVSGLRSIASGEGDLTRRLEVKSQDEIGQASQVFNDMMTNFATIRRSVKKMQNIDRMLNDTTLTSITKKERLTLTRERAKLEKELGGIANLNRIPSALFIVDIHHEHIALAEAKRLGIKTFGMVDTNSDPNKVDFPIPANDDASKSVKIIVSYVVEAIREGLEERRLQGATEEA